MFRDLGLAAALAFSGAVSAQAYPSKPVRLIIPAASGALEIMGRAVTQKMAEPMGQPFVVEARPGANGMIGSDHVAKSAPDGYTILLATSSTHASAPYSYKSMPYDPVKDFTPLAPAVSTVNVVASSLAFPASSVAELIDYAKKNPGKVTYSTSGVGSVLHMIGEMFQQQFGVSLTHVPYKGSAPAMTAVVTGEVNIGFTGTAEAIPQLRAGKARILAVTESTRYKPLGEVPALAEFLPAYEKPPGWFAFFGPAGMPQPVVGRLNAEMVKALNAPDVVGTLAKFGFVVTPGSPEELAQLLKRSLDIYARAAKLAGVKPE
jgi:tripartite-type tricarboxylate transporter receptor subunit TctC